jgi:hypothetical protein
MLRKLPLRKKMCFAAKTAASKENVLLRVRQKLAMIFLLERQ